MSQVTKHLGIFLAYKDAELETAYPLHTAQLICVVEEGIAIFCNSTAYAWLRQHLCTGFTDFNAVNGMRNNGRC